MMGFDFEIEALSDGALVGSLGVHHCDRRVGSFFYGVATTPHGQQRA